MRPDLSPSNVRIARIVAAVADAVQIMLLPAFVVGGFSPFNAALDVAFAAIIMDLAEILCENERFSSAPSTWLPTGMLADIFVACVHEADRARIRDPEYLHVFGMNRRDCEAGQLWRVIAERPRRQNSARASAWRPMLEYVLDRGPLARRLLRAVGPRPSRGALHELYAALADALQEGRPFDP